MILSYNLIISKINYDKKSLENCFSCNTIILHSFIASSITKYYCIHAEYNGQQLVYTTNALYMVKLFYNIIISKVIYDKEYTGNYSSCTTIILHSNIASSYTKYYCIYAEYNSQQTLYTTSALSRVMPSYKIINSRIIHDKESLEFFFPCLTIILHSIITSSYSRGEKSDEDEHKSSAQTCSQPNPTGLLPLLEGGPTGDGPTVPIDNG